MLEMQSSMFGVRTTLYMSGKSSACGDCGASLYDCLPVLLGYGTCVLALGWRLSNVLKYKYILEDAPVQVDWEYVYCVWTTVNVKMVLGNHFQFNTLICVVTSKWWKLLIIYM